MDRLTAMQKENERLQNIIKPAYERDEAVKKLAVYEKAEQEGRLHIAPCADGTLIEFADEEEAARIMESIDGEENHFYRHGLTESIYGECGEDWFIARQEAKKALESNQQAEPTT